MIKTLKNLFKSVKGSVNDSANKLFAGLMVVVLATALAPTMFAAILNLTGVSGVPTWVTTVLPIIVGMGLVFLIWRVFGGQK